MAKVVNPLDTCKYFFIFIFFIPRFANSELAKRAKKAPRFTATRHTLMKFEIFRDQWKFSGDKHKSLQVDTERTFHQRYPLAML